MNHMHDLRSAILRCNTPDDIAQALANHVGRPVTIHYPDRSPAFLPAGRPDVKENATRLARADQRTEEAWQGEAGEP